MSAATTGEIVQLHLEGIEPVPVLDKRPVPAECDLQTYKYVKFDMLALQGMKSWAVSARRDPRLGYYLVNLMLRSWHELPAGSLPADEELLCEMARCDFADWPAVRRAILADWPRCLEDGRRYNPVFCEAMVKVAWESREKFRARAGAGGRAKAERERVARENAALAWAMDAAASSKPEAGPEHAKGGGGEGEKEGRRRGEDSPRPAAGLGGAGGAGGGAEKRSLREVLETEGVEVLRLVTRRTEAACRELLGQFCQDSGDHDESVLRIIQAAYRAKLAGRPKAEPVSWMRGAILSDAAERRASAEKAVSKRPPRGRRSPAPASADNQATRHFAHFLNMRGPADLPPEEDDRPFEDAAAAIEGTEG